MEVLQTISKRVHYGKFVSEVKFLEDPAAFIPHIQNRNRDALGDLITKPEVERRLLQRLRKKALVYAQDFAPDGEPKGGETKVDVDGIVELYENYIIPLTKEVEVSEIKFPSDKQSIDKLRPQVDYLLVRLDGLSQEEIDQMMSKKSP